MKDSSFVSKIGLPVGFRLAAALASVLVVLIPAAHAAPPGHNVSAANITVIQNDPGNTTNSVATFTSLSINDFRVRGTGAAGDDKVPLNSAADFAIQIGSEAAGQVTNGIVMTSVTQNGRNNGNGTNDYCIACIEAQRALAPTNAAYPNFLEGAYWIPTFNANNTGAGNSDEFNVNVAAAYFPYTSFWGGFARNHGPNDEYGQNSGGFTNGGVLNQLIGTPSLVLGQNFIDLGGGKSFVTLTNFGIDSRASGILLVTGAKNESANFGMGQANTNNGGWNLFIKDNGSTSLTGYEQDPIAWVFIPKTNTALVSGRFQGNASISFFSGNSAGFTVTTNSPGTYELKITGKSATNGVLIISPECGSTVNQDNMVSYQVNAAGDGFIIQSRDTANPAASGANGEAIPAGESVVSFVYIPGPTPGFTVVPTNNLFTSEDGDQAVFTVVLDKQPTADVTIAVSSSNTAEGTVSTNSLTFSTTNWNVPQTVTVTGVNDAVIDGAVAYTVVLGAATSADPIWNGLDPSDVSVVNLDNDSAITVSPTSGLVTTEAGGTATFDVHLNSQPTADVTIGISSSNTGEGTVSPSSLTFSSLNWSNDQTVTVTGVNDFMDDGDKAYTVITAPAVSADGFFNGQNAADVSVINTDDDTAGLTVSAAGPAGLSVIEGHTNTYTVVLNSQPTANVTVNVSSSNTSQGGTVSPATLTFTSGNWSNAQTVAVAGADDLANDGNTAWFITNSISSTDPIYAALTPIPVLMTTLDNEPYVGVPSGTLLYGVGLAGVGLDGRATLSDSNAPNYNGGTVTATLTANATSSDRLEVRNTGIGANEIGVSGSNVSYGGTAIGTLAGGNGATPLVITLNGSANATSVQALLRNITFRNVSSSPSLNTRAVSVTVAHADGGSGSASEAIRLGLLHYSDFQEGLDHGYGVYSGEGDINLREADPGTPYPTGSNGSLFTDPSDPAAHNAWNLLMRFDNIVGASFGQIPSNATIVSAELTLNVPPEISNSTGDGSPLYRMLIPWNATNETWNTMGTGVDQDDVESRSTYDSQLGLLDGSATTGTGGASISVFPDVLAWQLGASNYGWVMPGWLTNFDGTSISAGEDPIENYRPRLRVLWLPPGSTSVSYRQNVNGYTNVADTQVRPAAPVTSFANTISLFVDANISTNDPSDVLIKFDNIIGNGPNQIPAGARVNAAILDIASVANNAMGNGGTFHAMLIPWQSTSTWNALGGVAPDDVKSASTVSASAGVAALSPIVQGGYHSFELTADVQSWAAGARANNGWVVFPWPNGGDGWSISSSESANAVERPQLRVYFTPPIAITSITRNPTSVTLQLTGDASTTYYIQRATVVTGAYATVGNATTAPDGTASFTDNSPPAGAAFYRLSTSP